MNSALISGKVGGYGTDVLDTEPQKKTTPHRSAQLYHHFRTPRERMNLWQDKPAWLHKLDFLSQRREQLHKPANFNHKKMKRNYIIPEQEHNKLDTCL